MFLLGDAKSWPLEQISLSMLGQPGTVQCYVWIHRSLLDQASPVKTLLTRHTPSDWAGVGTMPAGDEKRTDLIEVQKYVQNKQLDGCYLGEMLSIKRLRSLRKTLIFQLI